jgi:ABC-type cobalamin/Fe3+-siderophores transport system ATPase subunit
MGIIELRDIHFAYQDARFINKLSLHVENGDFIGLVGPNGSGKTTMLKLMAGLIKPAAGDVVLWNKSLHTYKGSDRAKLMSYLPQMLDITLPIKVREIVALGLSPYDVQQDISIESAMDMVAISDKAGYDFCRLSGGEKRRVFIAMTLMQRAGLLLLDEPLANLDIKFQLEIMNLLRDLNVARKMTVVMAIHDLSMAFYFDRIVLVKEGQILADGRPDKVLNDDSIKEVFGVDVKIFFNSNGRPAISYP